MTIETGTRRVATYERVSTDDQRERETIKTQADALERRLAVEGGIEVVGRYVDDGVSGMKKLAERPAGGRLLVDAARHAFDELWVYRTDRLGRNLADMAGTGQRLEQLGISILSVAEGQMQPFLFDLMAVLAQNEHRTFRQRSADGIQRAAGEGRYLGGIVPFGYRVAGQKHTARLEPDTAPLWADLSAADVVRHIYRRLGVEGWSCQKVAHDLNALGVPTHYARDGRMVKHGERKERTQGVWRAGRIRNLVVNPVYRGELLFGRRTSPETSGREVISARVEPLVSDELWQATQDTLQRNRIAAKNVRHTYLLRGAIRCGTCGLTYCGSQGRPGVGWYRCNGQLADRGPVDGRCHNPAVRTDHIEPVVLADLEAFLRNPGDVITELESEREAASTGAVIEAESIVLRRALEGLDGQRRRALNLNVRGLLSDAELDLELARISAEQGAAQLRLAALAPVEHEDPPVEAVTLLDEVRARLDTGLSAEQWQEIVSLLVRIVVRSEPAEGRSARPKAIITYRFPGVVETRTDTGSLPQRAGSVPDNERVQPPGRC